MSRLRSLFQRGNRGTVKKKRQQVPRIRVPLEENDTRKLSLSIIERTFDCQPRSMRNVPLTAPSFSFLPFISVPRVIGSQSVYQLKIDFRSKKWFLRFDFPVIFGSWPVTDGRRSPVGGPSKRRSLRPMMFQNRHRLMEALPVPHG